MVTAMKVSLNGYCTPGDACDDINAVCRNGFCICQLGYYDNGRDVCGRYNTGVCRFPRWLGGVVVRTLDLRLSRRLFESRS